jgi:HEAT repeat protein
VGQPFLKSLWSAVGKHSAQIQETDRKSIEQLTKANITSLEELMNVAVDSNMDKEVRQTACWALGKLREKRAVNALLSVLSEKEPYLYWESAKSLGLLGSKRAVQPIIGILQNDPNLDKRAAAAYALNLLADDRAVEPLLEAVNNTNESPNVREYALEALSNIALSNGEQDKIIDTLISCLEDPDVGVQFTAAVALGNHGDSKAIPYLEILSSKSQDVVTEWGAMSEAADDSIASIRQLEEERAAS